MEGINKTFEITGSKGITAKVTVAEDYSTTKNTSTLTVSVSLKNSQFFGHTYYLNGTIKAGGTTLQTFNSSKGTHYVTISALDTYYAIKTDNSGFVGSPWKTTISHNADGSKRITISVDITGYEPSGKGSNGFTVSGSETFDLTTIPQESTIGATDANIGATSAITVYQKSSGYKHSIRYEFGNVSGYITASGGTTGSETKIGTTSISFNVPTSFYAQIPNAKSGKCTLTCKTYSGSTQVGSAKTCTFTATASKEECAPTVDGTVEDTNEKTVALTGNKSKIVKYASNAKCTISATAKNSASISTKKIDGKEISGTTKTINGFSGDSIKFTATDSRGYSRSKTVDLATVEYVPLTCVVSAKRTDIANGKATLTIKGKYFDGSFGAQSNQLTVRYKKPSGDWTSVTATKSSGSYSASVNLTDLDYTKSYTLRVEVADKISTITGTVVVNKGIPVFDWGESDFVFHVPVKHEGGMSPVDLGGGALISTEADFISALDSVYNAMGNKESKWIRFRGFPTRSDYSFYGMLTRTTENSGNLYVQSAYDDGSLLTLVKRDGNWKSFERVQLRAYPVGSIYMSVNSTSPASLFGGTWERLKDYVLVGASDNFSAGAAAGVISFASGGGSSGKQAICLAVYVWKRTE